MSRGGRLIVVGAGAIGASLARAAMARASVIVADPDPRVREAFSGSGGSVATLDPRHGWVGFDLRAGDVAIVATRTTIAEGVLAALPADLPAIFVGNGINPRLAACRSGPTITGVVDFAATCDEPGRPRATQAGTLTMPAHAPGGATAFVAAALAGSAIKTLLAEDMRPHQWAKVVLNASLDPVAALSGRTLGGVFAHRPAFLLMRRLLREGLAAVRASGVAPAPVRGTPIATMVRVFHAPLINHLAARVAAGQARAVQSTMRADVAAGAETEATYLNGAIAEAGEAAGCPAPTHRAVAKAIEAMRGRPLTGAITDGELLAFIRP